MCVTQGKTQGISSRLKCGHPINILHSSRPDRSGRLSSGCSSKIKNAFQWDAYRRLVDRIPACTVQGCMSASGGGCLPGGYLPLVPGHPPCLQSDTCENMTYANIVCGR